MGMNPDFCCCGVGCNGWWHDGQPSSGFEGNIIDGSEKLSCNRWDDCDGDGVPETYVDCACPTTPDGEPNICCGPGVPDVINISSSVLWDFAWRRTALNLRCQGAGIGVPLDPPTVSYDCTDRNFTQWEPTSWEWRAGGSISGLQLELSVDGDTNAGEMPSGCCAKYYYGSVALDGPTAPGLNDNPWGMDLAGLATVDCGPQLHYSAPPKLRAYGRLLMMFRGEGPNEVVPVVHERLTLLTRLDIIIGLDGYGETWGGSIVGNRLPEYKRTTPVSLFNFTSVFTDGCNCNGFGYIEPPAEVEDQPVIHILDTVDWSNNLKVVEQSFWNYAHPHPIAADNTYTIDYGRSYSGSGTNVCGCGSARADPNCCPDEPLYTIASYSGCDDIFLPNCTGGCANPKPWALGHAVIGANFSCANDGHHVWTTNEKLDWSGPPSVYNGEGGPFGGVAANDGTSWESILGGCTDPCGAHGDTGQTHTVVGGFKAGGAPVNFPTCGLRNFQIQYPGYPGVENLEF